MNKKTVRDIDVQGKKILLRCDFNVPLDKDMNITDNRRIISSLETIKYLLEHNAKIIICSHLGRPKGEYKKEFSLEPIAKELSKLLVKKIKFAQDSIGDSAKKLTQNMDNREIILLENLRFYKEEEKNDPEFSKQLADLAEIYVNDAFGSVHRAHSSTEGVAHYLPAVCGFLIEKEIQYMSNALKDPKRPFVSILGGVKVSDKIGVIENLLDKIDTLLIGGAMAYTFIKANGGQIGNSVCEYDKLELAKEIMSKAEQKNVKLLLPVDTKISTEYSNEAETQVVNSYKIPEGWEGLDIGPNTIDIYSKILNNAKTIIWNGPLGVCEFPKFVVGTQEIAKVVAEADAVSIIGGGDSAAAIEQLGLADKMTHISTGGGASLEFLEGKSLPGIECLLNK